LIDASQPDETDVEHELARLNVDLNDLYIAQHGILELLKDYHVDITKAQERWRQVKTRARENRDRLQKIYRELENLRGSSYFGKEPWVENSVQRIVAAKNATFYDRLDQFPESPPLTDSALIRDIVGAAERLKENDAEIKKIQAKISAYLASREEEKGQTRVEKWRHRLENNRLIAAIILLSAIVGGIAQFTDAVEKLRSFFNPALAVEQLKTRGDEELAQGKFKEAEDTFREILRWSPRDTQAHLGLGKSLLRQNRFDEARREFDGCEADWRCADDNALTYIEQANFSDRPELRRKAVPLLEDINRKFPDEYKISVDLGMVYLKTGNDEGARAALLKVKDEAYAEPPLNVYCVYNLCLADLHLAAAHSTDPARASTLRQEAASLLSEAARRATLNSDSDQSRRAFSQLLRDLSGEELKELTLAPSWAATVVQIREYGFLPPG
jgi:Flp pilus assembly protein TadD